jgi:hypothetical protein
MRTAIILAAASLIVGGIVGGVLARQEFVRETLPIMSTSALGGSDSATSGSEGPRLVVVGGERYDFGEMDRSAVMTHTFEITNQGTAPLTLNQEGTSCKCTSAGLDKDQLNPGDTARITMEWNAKGAHEPFEQYAEYTTNDPLRPKIKLTVWGRIVDTLRAEPNELIFNRVSAHEPAQAKVKIFGVREKELQVLEHRFTHSKTAPKFSAHFEPLPAEEVASRAGFTCGLEMTVHIEPGMPLGQINQGMEIITNLNPDAKFEIPIYGSIVSDISLAGPNVAAELMQVTLGSFPTSQGAKSTVYLVVKGPHREQTKITIAGVSPAAELTATIGEPLRKNPQIVSFPVTLEVPPGTPPVSRMSAGGTATVQVHTTHPHLKELTFRVRYAVLD